jgi:hypothetical protein
MAGSEALVRHFLLAMLQLITLAIVVLLVRCKCMLRVRYLEYAFVAVIQMVQPAVNSWFDSMHTGILSKTACRRVVWWLLGLLIQAIVFGQISVILCLCCASNLICFLAGPELESHQSALLGGYLSAESHSNDKHFGEFGVISGYMSAAPPVFWVMVHIIIVSLGAHRMEKKNSSLPWSNASGMSQPQVASSINAQPIAPCDMAETYGCVISECSEVVVAQEVEASTDHYTTEANSSSTPEPFYSVSVEEHSSGSLEFRDGWDEAIQNTDGIAFLNDVATSSAPSTRAEHSDDEAVPAESMQMQRQLSLWSSACREWWDEHGESIADISFFFHLAGLLQQTWYQGVGELMPDTVQDPSQLTIFQQLEFFLACMNAGASSNRHPDDLALALQSATVISNFLVPWLGQDAHLSAPAPFSNASFFDDTLSDITDTTAGGTNSSGPATSIDSRSTLGDAAIGRVLDTAASLGDSSSIGGGAAGDAASARGSSSIGSGVALLHRVFENMSECSSSR